MGSMMFYDLWYNLILHLVPPSVALYLFYDMLVFELVLHYYGPYPLCYWYISY
jgi:hypothetical protein